MTVQDFVNDKENVGTVVVVDLAFNEDLCDPLRKELWRGCIEDTPKEYWPLEVLGTGWMIGQQMPVITVIKSEQKNVLTAGKALSGQNQITKSL